MKYCLVIMLFVISSSFVNWEPDFEKAKQVAKEKHELILLNFSGSDWCGPCIRMRKEIFDDSGFTAMMVSRVVMVNADFPRNKKNQLDKKTKAQNEALADKYNPEGKFPFTLLLDADGKVVKSWDGLPDENATQLSLLIKNICDQHK